LPLILHNVLFTLEISKNLVAREDGWHAVHFFGPDDLCNAVYSFAFCNDIQNLHAIFVNDFSNDVRVTYVD